METTPSDFHQKHDQRQLEALAMLDDSALAELTAKAIESHRALGKLIVTICRIQDERHGESSDQEALF